MMWGSKKKEDLVGRPRSAPPTKQPAPPEKNTLSPKGSGQVAPQKAGTRSPSDSSAVVPRDELPMFLVSEGYISEEQVRKALKTQQETGMFFGEVLAQEGVLDKESLVSFLAKHCRIPHIGLLDYVIDKSILELIPEEICWKYHLLPVDKLGRNLTIAMVNPLNQKALQAVRDLYPDLRAKPILCSHENFEIVAERLFGKREGHDEKTWAQVSVTSEPEDSKTESKAAEPSIVPSSEGMSETRSSAEAVSVESEPPVEPEAALPGEAAISEESEPTIDLASEQSEQPALSRESEPVGDVSVSKAEEEVDAGATTKIMDNDGLLDSVFGDVQAAPAEESGVGQAMAAPPEENRKPLEALMRLYTGALVNSMHDTYELLARKIHFFNGLNPEDVAKIFSQGKVIEAKPAEMLFNKGDEGDIMYVILNGRVKIRAGTKQIAILQTGDIFGEMALVSDAPRSAAAITVTQSNLLRLSFDDIRNNLPPHVATQLLVNIIVTLAERLRLANQA